MNKIIKSLMTLLILFVLTGCGAKVTQSLTLNENGSGEREIIAYIDSETIDYINGGIDALTKILEDNLPEPLTMMVDKAEDGTSCLYTFQYSFTDLDDYNSKTALITGVQHNAAIVDEENPFSTIQTFSENDVFEALMTWGLDAVEFAELTSQSRSNYYENNGFYVSFRDYRNEEISTYDNIIWLSSGENIPIDNVDVNVDFINNKFALSIKLLSSQFDQLNKSKVDTYFEGATFRKDDNYSIYTYSFDTYEAYQSFIGNEVAGESIYNITSNSPINKKYYFEEYYNISDLFPETYLDGNIMYTISLKNIDDANIYESYLENKEKDRLTYRFNDTVDVDIDYEKSLYANKTITELLLDNNKDAKKTITVKFSSSELEEFNFDEIESYYEELGYNVEVNTDEPSLTFTTKYTIDSSYSDESSITSFYKAASSNFKKNKIHFVETFNYSNLMPTAESVYIVKLNKKLSPSYVNVNGNQYTKQDIKDSLLGNHYEFIVDNSNSTSQVKIICEKNNLSYNLVIILLIILVAAGVVVGYLKSKGKKTSDNEDVIVEDSNI